MKHETKLTIEEKLKARFGEAYASHEQIAKYTYNHLGGVARHLVRATSAHDLLDAIKIAQADKVPYSFLGNGAGSLWSDIGYNGLVLVNLASGITPFPESSQLLVESGISLSALANYACAQGLSGLESFSGIPASLGGAVVGQVTSTDGPLAKFVKELLVVRDDSEEIKRMPVTEYLEGGFSGVIVAARLQLARLTQDETIKRFQKKRRRYDKRIVFRNIFTQVIDAPLMLNSKNNILRQDKNDLQAFFLNSKVTSLELKNWLTQLSATEGLELKIKFMGYWPDEG